MERLVIITGADGHLGGTLVRLLRKRKARVRGLILPGHMPPAGDGVTYIQGDVREPESLEPLFQDIPAGTWVCLIHTAGIVDISGEVLPLVRAVNVDGTKHILSLCQKHAVDRLVYVSSVHAIPEGDKTQVLHEITHFDPDAVVVHPSGILGPYDRSGNHLVQLVNDYLQGKLPACVTGGYDFVDVRDVALGCLLEAEKGRKGECYILSNRHYEVRELLSILRSVAGGRRLPVLPMWMARAAAPGLQWLARRQKKRPLYTSYSLYTLRSNDKFSHDKATAELGYRPRDLVQTLRDTAAWLRGKNSSAKGEAH